MTEKKARSNSVISTKVEGHCINFTVAGAGTLELDLRKLSPEVIYFAQLHGLKQRISDAAALAWDSKGAKPTAVDKFEAMRELVEFYNSGTVEWNRPRKGGGGARDLELPMLIEALSRLYPERTEEQLKEWIGKRSKEDRAALLVSEKIKPIIDELRAKQASSVNTEDLLMDLETLAD